MLDNTCKNPIVVEFRLEIVHVTQHAYVYTVNLYIRTIEIHNVPVQLDLI